MSPATSPQQPIAVAIVDDNRLVRDALAALLGRIADFRIEAARVADDAFMLAVKADVLLLDVGLADDDSLKVAAALSRGFPSTKIVMMDLIPVHDDIVQLVNAGVSGFVLKDATFDEFVATIRSVAAGDKVLPPRMTESLFSQIVRSAATAAPAEVLDDVRMTRREREVVELIGEGLSNKEIAQRLDIASHTVKSHVRNVMEKLALHTRLQIAAYVRRDSGP
ncbi:MAG TPA: response regulator transcription factor [Gemmatimonadaceae bacterium]|nr:response regulator transcription factor [Gemmatimonadaceae bacterium]